MKMLFSPDAPSIRTISRDFGVPRATIQVWMKQAGIMSSRQVNSADKDKYWSPQVKLDAVIKSITLSEDDYGEYLRKNGLYSSLVTQWKEKTLESLVSVSSRERENKTEISKESIRRSGEYKELKKELQRKEKALAEITALLVLKKKADLIWGEEEEKALSKTGSKQ